VSSGCNAAPGAAFFDGMTKVNTCRRWSNEFTGGGHQCWSLFSDAIHQEKSNTIVNNNEPSSSEALFPFGYNDLQTKVVKDIPSSFQRTSVNINKAMKEH
jgi:hypothetical protein